MSASSVVAAAAAAAEGDRPEHSGQAHVADSEPLLPAETQQQISTRCGQAMQGAITSLCIYLGHELGLYKTLHGMGPSTAQQLATAAGLSERWVREWLYQQSASRLVCCDSNAERFWLTEAQAQVLVEPATFEEARESPLEMVLKMPVVLSKHEKLLDSFRTGVGLSFDDTGIDHCEMHRHARAVQLEQRLHMLPGLVEKLEQGVKVADVGCGSGEVVMHLAALFPNSTFVGYDISKRALSAAEQRKAARGLENVTFLNPADGPESRLPGKPTFHMIVVLDAIHDMTNPQEMLSIIRQSLAEDTCSSRGPTPPHTPALPATADQGQSHPQQQQQQQTQEQQMHTQEQQQHQDKGQHNHLPDALSSYSGGPVFLVTDIKSTGDAKSNIATMPSAPFLYGEMARKMSAAAGFKRFSKLEWDADNGMNWHSHYMMTP